VFRQDVAPIEMFRPPIAGFTMVSLDLMGLVRVEATVSWLRRVHLMTVSDDMHTFQATQKFHKNQSVTVDRIGSPLSQLPLLGISMPNETNSALLIKHF